MGTQTRIALLTALAVAVTGVGTAASAAGPPAGTAYRRDVTSTDLAKAGSAAPYGVWRLQITSRGLSLSAKGQGLVPERAAWAAGKVTVSDTPGAVSIFCGATVKGVYKWRLTGSAVALTLVKDPCKDRAGVVPGRWLKTH